MVQPLGRNVASDCIQPGATSIGHRQPPSAASAMVPTTPMPSIWPLLRGTLTSSSASDALNAGQANRVTPTNPDRRAPVHPEQQATDEHGEADLHQPERHARQPLAGHDGRRQDRGRCQAAQQALLALDHHLDRAAGQQHQHREYDHRAGDGLRVAARRGLAPTGAVTCSVTWRGTTARTSNASGDALLSWIEVASISASTM